MIISFHLSLSKSSHHLVKKIMGLRKDMHKYVTTINYVVLLLYTTSGSLRRWEHVPRIRSAKSGDERGFRVRRGVHRIDHGKQTIQSGLNFIWKLGRWE